ncbi:MAG: hypothetical protein ACI8QC_004347 [Planctomycetota bacterium]|jgi:hypothetical protein
MVATWGYFFYDGLVRPTLEGVQHEGDYLVGGMMPVAVIFAAATAALVIVSLMTSPPSDEHVDQFMVNS